LHARARAHYERLDSEGARLVTTSYVVDETATRLRYDVGLDHALRFRDAIHISEQDKRLVLAWIDKRLASEAWAILEKLADVPLSFTDATTIAVARSRRIREIFAFDEDFEAAGISVGPS
jgi:hypothetical protein